MLEMLSDNGVWEKFYDYKASLCCTKSSLKELRGFIDSKAYLPVCENIFSGKPFPLPRKSVISKNGTSKKRTVYTFPKNENTVLKLLTYLLIRKYDGVFANDLFSFRPGLTAKDAVKWILGVPGIENMCSYKADISNYFNSVNVDLLLPILKETAGNDKELFDFLSSLLTEPYVIENGMKKSEPKGIMAGTPVSSFFANLFLKELDETFYMTVPYARYSDDIIVFSEDKQKLNKIADYIRDFLTARGLSVNKEKEYYTAQGEEWTFLGFSHKNGVVDISPVSVAKLKGKMRRKTNALMRWSKRGNISGELAAKAFIRIFNNKLFENAADNELTWSRWFFPVINTSKGLHEIDLYAQDCIRYLISGKRTKARYNVRYARLKDLGYRSLVNEYYKANEQEKS